MEDKIISRACNALAEGDLEGAKRIVEMEYPHRPLKPNSRNCTEQQSTKIFVKDGFIDRYSGKRLVFPPVLRLLSHIDAGSIAIPEKLEDVRVSYCILAVIPNH
jgi:hypothetical protein